MEADIHHERHIKLAPQGRDIREIRYPQLVGPLGLEYPGHAILRTRRCRITDRRAHDFTATNALQAKLSHQPLNGAARHDDAFTVHLPPDFVGTVDLPIRMPDALAIYPEPLAPLGALAAQFELPLPSGMSPITRRGNLYDVADWLDPVLLPMLVDKSF